MKCPNLKSYRDNAATNEGNKPKMVGVYRGDTRKMAIATYWPRAAGKGYDARETQGRSVRNGG